MNRIRVLKAVRILAHCFFTGFAFFVENGQRTFPRVSCFDIFRRPDSVYLVSEREEGNRHESVS